MDDNLFFHICSLLFSVLISCASQVLLKKSSQIRYDSRIKEYLNFRVILACSVFFIATLLTIYAYRVVPLTTGAMLEASGYFYVTIFDRIFFQRKITLRRVLALLIIVFGIVVFTYFG